MIQSEKMSKLKTLSILLAGAALVGCGEEPKSDIAVFFNSEIEYMTYHAKENIEDVKQLKGIENVQCEQVDESAYKVDEQYDTYVCSYYLTFFHVDSTEEEPVKMGINIASYVGYSATEKWVSRIDKMVGSASDLNLKFESINDYL